MYPGSDGQIRTETEEKHTIELNSLGLGLTDFASPSINELRGQKEISDLKKSLIMYAEKFTKKETLMSLLKKSIYLILIALLSACNETVSTNHSYNLEFCDNCNTVKEIDEFEKRKGSKKIDLTNEQAYYIFYAISCNLFDLSEEGRKELSSDNHYFIQETNNHFIKEVSAYSTDSDGLSFYAKKYFYNDPILDTIINLNYENNFDEEELRNVFNDIRKLQRLKFESSKEYHYDPRKSCKKSELFKIGISDFFEKKLLKETHSNWSNDSTNVTLIYDFSFIFNKINKEKNEMNVSEEDRAIYFLFNYDILYRMTKSP